MKEHPILFSTEMVQAIFERRKTQTRRVVKPQPKFLDENGWPWELTPKEGPIPYDCPYGQPGDRLWVRETFARTDGKYEPEITYSYFADSFHWSFFPEAKTNEETCCQWHDPDLSKEVKWKPSIHMPKTAARIWLEIEEVKVERLQDISEEDAKAEGILPLLASSMQLITQDQLYFDYSKPKQFFNDGLPAFWSFNSLWCSINGSESWEANPWVWVVKFKVISITGVSSTQNPAPIVIGASNQQPV